MSLPRLLRALAATGLVLLALPSHAVDLPKRMTFQGRLVRTDGSPETAPQSLRFALYATLTGGAPLWEESFPTVLVTNGYYSVVLGEKVPLPSGVLNGQALYLGVSLVGQSELTPRLPVVSVPYALLADDSNRLGGRDASQFAPASHGHASVPLAENSNQLGGRDPSAFADRDHTHPVASTTADGFMSAADKVKLNAQPSVYSNGTNGLSLNAGTLSVAFLAPGGTNGTATTAARSNHTHPTPTLACTYRSAKGNTDTGRNSTAWCANTEILTGGGCMDLAGATPGEGITFGPTGPSFVDSPNPLGGPGYVCRWPLATASNSVPTAYAICCRNTP